MKNVFAKKQTEMLTGWLVQIIFTYGEINLNHCDLKHSEFSSDQCRNIYKCQTFAILRLPVLILNCAK